MERKKRSPEQQRMIDRAKEIIHSKRNLISGEGNLSVEDQDIVKRARNLSRSTDTSETKVDKEEENRIEKRFKRKRRKVNPSDVADALRRSKMQKEEISNPDKLFRRAFKE